MVFKAILYNNTTLTCITQTILWLCDNACIYAGADPGFWERGGLINIFTTGGGYGRGISPSCDSKGVWGSADSSPSGVWGEAPAALLLLRLFSM